MATSKRKMFGMPNATQQQVSSALSTQEGDEGALEMLPMERVTIDPDNPRQLGIDPSNPRLIADNDPRASEKQAELEELENMALSIASEGVITPIRVYRRGKDFRIAHGERRFLASVLAGKTSIPGVVLKERPKALRLQQLIENFQRKGLTLHSRLENIQSVIEEATSLKTAVTGANELRELTGLGRSQSFKYMTVLGATQDVKSAIKRGEVTDLSFAAELTKIHDPILRARAIKEGRAAANKAKEADAPAKNKPKSLGRPPSVKLCNVRHTDVARRIIEAVAGTDRYQIDWTDPKAVSKIFKKMITDMEEGTL